LTRRPAAATKTCSRAKTPRAPRENEDPGQRTQDAEPSSLCTAKAQQRVLLASTSASRKPRDRSKPRRARRRWDQDEGKKVRTREGRSVFSPSHPPTLSPSALSSWPSCSSWFHLFGCGRRPRWALGVLARDIVLYLSKTYVPRPRKSAHQDKILTSSNTGSARQGW